MFGEGSETEKAEARAKLNGLITNKIEELGDTLGDAFRDGNLGETIIKIMNDVLDDIAIEVYEATDGRFMSDTAGRAYIRRGETRAYGFGTRLKTRIKTKHKED